MAFLTFFQRCIPAVATVQLNGTVPGTDQVIVVEREVMAHLARYRQTSRCSTEAGGQLFGAIDQHLVRVVKATGPYRGDERSRYRYRSNPICAQRAIDDQSRQGLLYLGEWHTHAEDRPDASEMDGDVMLNLITHSKLNSNALLLMIIGRDDPPEGVALFSVYSAGTTRWRLTLDSTAS